MTTAKHRHSFDDGTAPAVIAGAGLAGCLIALMFAQRGREVIVFEKRSDPREQGAEAGRSINLALSERGRDALRRVGLEDAILKECLPMYGRILHDRSGRIVRQPYGPNREHILSVSRSELNRRLIEAADAHPHVEFRFRSPIEDVDVASPSVTYRHPETGRRRKQDASLVIGADGAFSVVREKCRVTGRYDYAQSFLGHGYKELSISPNASGAHRLDADGLHIWPRHDFMLIALPNTDGSFTVTLFLPWEGEHSFESLDSPARVRAFFDREFPDVLPLLDTLESEFFNNPTGSMVTIDTAPYHYGDRVVLVGDAAHAIVPFYGQGMNAAFEDCAALVDAIDEADGDVATAVRAYSESRIPNAQAIRDLALANFHEMQSDVARPLFRLRKALERSLERHAPETFRSLYSMVSFSTIPYAEAVERSARQSRAIEVSLAAAALCGLTGALLLVRRWGTGDESPSSDVPR